MVSDAEYRKPTSWWRGRRVIAEREIVNGYMTLPAGTVFTVRAKFKGFEMYSEPCGCCGGRMNVTRVDRSAVSLLGDTA